VILATETILSHFTHFYLTFCTDLAAARYPAEAAKRFTAWTGSHYGPAVKARSELTGILGLLAGKWPNTLAMQPGGLTKALTRSDLDRCAGILAQFRAFVEDQVLGGPLDRWLDNRGMADLERWANTSESQASDVGFFIQLALTHGFHRLGRGPGRFLSSGWPLPGNAMWLKPGFFENGTASALDPNQVTEHVRHSWFRPYPGGRAPMDGLSEPAPTKDAAYSWCKAPRYAGQPAEVGPLARMVVAEDPLITDAFRQFGSVVFTRMLARVHEMFRLLTEAAVWLRQISPDEPFYAKDTPQDAASGFSLLEAPRGMLGHWVRIERGRIRNYQVVTPTAWNLSPRDDQGQPGPLESALVGLPVHDVTQPLTLAHTVRSYDPCLFCTVH
ncbi:MAG: nickel-dependent hydrogenase large subunit, partial [Planctomycetes bacterium]|nr:nickel-dependent hydrogenase large subunit [Planctomycetota bacterium]